MITRVLRLGKNVNTMETKGSRTTCEKKATAYKCKNEEETGKQQKLCIILCRYGQSKYFGQYLSSHGFKMTPTHLKTLHLDDLEDMLTRCRSWVNEKDTSSWMEDKAFEFLKQVKCNNGIQQTMVSWELSVITVFKL